MSKPLLILVIMALFAVSVNVAYAQTPPTTPTISTVAITSSPGTDNTYTTLDVITVGLTFSEAVTVTGTPYVVLDIGGQPRNAAYTGAGTATGQILFGYTVLVGDRDTDGLSVLANSLTLNGGAIQSTDDSTDAALTHSVMTFARQSDESRPGFGRQSLRVSGWTKPPPLPDLQAHSPGHVAGHRPQPHIGGPLRLRCGAPAGR